MYTHGLLQKCVLWIYYPLINHNKAMTAISLYVSWRTHLDPNKCKCWWESFNREGRSLYQNRALIPSNPISKWTQPTMINKTKKIITLISQQCSKFMTVPQLEVKLLIRTSKFDRIFVVSHVSVYFKWKTETSSDEIGAMSTVITWTC